MAGLSPTLFSHRKRKRKKKLLLFFFSFFYFLFDNPKIPSDFFSLCLVSHSPVFKIQNFISGSASLPFRFSLMELPRRQDQSQSERKGQKRKLEEEIGEDREITVQSADARKAILIQVSEQVKVLDSSFSWSEADRNAAKRATHVLAELAKNG